MTTKIDQIEALARDAVREIFQSMLSLELTPDEATPLCVESPDQIASSVGFIGAAHGILFLYAGAGFAKTLTARMLSIPEEELRENEMVNDAFGELSNMVGGYVKSRLCDSGWSCTLTIPSVVRGKHLSIGGTADATRRVLGFRTGSERLLLELLVKQASS